MGVMAAISAGVAVGLLSEGTLRNDMDILTSAEGFPKMSQSALVLDYRGNAESSLSEAMISVIKQAFKR